MRAENFAHAEPQSARTEWVWRPQADPPDALVECP
jgi:hypothetical protein